MKKISLILAILMVGILVLASCGDKPAETTAGSTSATTSDASTTKATTTDSKGDKSVLYGTWTAVSGSATVTISESKITEKEGNDTQDLTYTIVSQKLDSNGNFVAVLKVGGVEYTYTVFAAKSGYSANGYLEIVTSKATIAYKK